jgi:NhaC family Na+:H+ antiporter
MRMARPKEPQPLSLAEAVIPVASLIFLIGLSYYLFGDAGAEGPNQVALVVATMIAVPVAWRRGHSLDALREAAVASVSSAISAIFILLAVGLLIGAWALSGTLVAMVYYGLMLLNPSYFYAAAAAVCAVISTCIGSSWTVVGTIGIGLMGIAQNMGLDPAITAAAVISGAYFGDTTSPLSDSANLAAATGGANLYDHIRETGLTSLASLAIALAVFWLLGKPVDFDATYKLAAIERAFHVTPLLLLPLVVVLCLALFKVPPFTAIFIGAMLGALLAVFVAPDRLVAFGRVGDDMPAPLAALRGTWLALASGYTSTTGDVALDRLATRGGMESMLGTIWLVITALAFGGVIEKAGVLDRLIAPVIGAAKSAVALVAAVVAAVLGTSVATADQYIAIVLPGRMFSKAFADRGYAPVVLTRTVGAAATPTSALIPWNSCGAFMAATLGVATFHYAPYAVFNIASPLLAIAFVGVRMPRGTRAEGRQPEDSAARLPDAVNPARHE